MAEKYDEQSIQVLEAIEAIRKRPGMYIGSLTTGAFHLVREIVDNAIDEFLAGHTPKIRVELDTGTNTVKIFDWGRGIPVKIHATTGISTLTTIFTETHAGGKFNNNSYKKSSGLHGVGATVANALSTTLTVSTHREKKCHTQTFARGIATTNVVPSKKQGDWATCVTLTPDKKIFGEHVIIEAATLHGWLRELSFLCPKLEIEFVCITPSGPCPYKFYSKNGLADMLEVITTAHKMDNITRFLRIDEEVKARVEGLDVSIEVDFIMAWTDHDGTIMRQYSNCLLNADGGTAGDAMWDSYAKAVKACAPNETVKSEDLRYGVMGILHVKVDDPCYKGQTKDRLENPEVYYALQPHFFNTFKDYFIKNPQLLKAIVSRAQELSKARERFKLDKAALKNIKLVGNDSAKGLPAKLVKAPNVTPSERWLYIVEGESASGSVVMARMKNKAGKLYQEVLPLRGKIINASRANMATVLASEEAQAIINSISAGIKDKCDPKKSRVSRILMMTDGDNDGYHIATLLCSLFVTFMQPLIDAGMLWVVKSPKLVAKYKAERYFGNTLDQLSEKIKQNSKIKVDAESLKPFLVTYLKGHGESSVEEVRAYAMNPDTATLRQLFLRTDSLAELDKIMGSESDMRKELVLGVQDDTRGSTS